MTPVNIFICNGMPAAATAGATLVTKELDRKKRLFLNVIISEMKFELRMLDAVGDEAFTAQHTLLTHTLAATPTRRGTIHIYRSSNAIAKRKLICSTYAWRSSTPNPLARMQMCVLTYYECTHTHTHTHNQTCTYMCVFYSNGLRVRTLLTLPLAKSTGRFAPKDT